MQELRGFLIAFFYNNIDALPCSTEIHIEDSSTSESISIEINKNSKNRVKKLFQNFSESQESTENDNSSKNDEFSEVRSNEVANIEEFSASSDDLLEKNSVPNTLIELVKKMHLLGGKPVFKISEDNENAVKMYLEANVSLLEQQREKLNAFASKTIFKNVY